MITPASNLVRLALMAFLSYLGKGRKLVVHWRSAPQRDAILIPIERKPLHNWTATLY
jgi:hypothetical protein